MEQSSLTLDRRLRDSVYELTFQEYVNVVLGDISILDIAKDVTDEERNAVRSIIMAEFAEITGNYDYISTVQTQYKRMKLGLKHMGLVLSSKILTVMYDKSTFDYLKEIRIISKNTEYPATLDELNEIINKIEIAINGLNVDIAEEEALLEKSKQENPAEKPSRKSFIKLLASVSQFVKFNVTFDTNAAIVAEYVNRMLVTVEQQNKDKK